MNVGTVDEVAKDMIGSSLYTANQCRSRQKLEGLPLTHSFVSIDLYKR